VSGQSRSPFASARELEEFSKSNRERYGQPVEQVDFYADIVADSLGLPSCSNREEACSLLEALRIGMNQVLDMEREDVQVLVIGRLGTDEVDALLYDPMPGGSGLLDQALDRWPEVVAATTELLEGCASVCERSCIDCLQTFRNAFFHVYLDRHVAIDRLRKFGSAMHFAHDIPVRLPEAHPKGSEIPVNEAETQLRALLQRAGFPQGQWHAEINLGRPLGSTSPDVFFPGDDTDDPGVCVYLDGLSQHIHGSPRTAARDRAIRDQLRSRYYEVFEIPASELFDRDAMARHFFHLARVLMERDRARTLRDDPSWFESGPAAGTVGKVLPFRRVPGDPSSRFRTCVPLVSLKAAAGASTRVLQATLRQLKRKRQLIRIGAPQPANLLDGLGRFDDFARAQCCSPGPQLHGAPLDGGVLRVARSLGIRDLTVRRHLDGGLLTLIVHVEEEAAPLDRFRCARGDAVLHACAFFDDVADRGQEGDARHRGQGNRRARHRAIVPPPSARRTLRAVGAHAPGGASG